MTRKMIVLHVDKCLSLWYDKITEILDVYRPSV